MAWELLKTDYVDAVFEGMRRYLVSENGDGSVSFHDVTNYTVKEGTFFGAKDANRINTAVNAILAALENGTDLYEVFTQFFEIQKELFLQESDNKQEGFEVYIANLRQYMDGKWDELKEEYTGDIQYFKDIQENAFNVWFQMIRDQLTNDVAGHLQLQIGDLNKLKTDEKDDLVSAINDLVLSYDETMAILAGVVTVTVIADTNDGESLPDGLFATLSLINADGKERDIARKDYINGVATFEVYSGMKYIVRSKVFSNHLPTSSTFIAGHKDMEVNVVYKLNAYLKDLSWEKIFEIADRGKAGTAFRLYDTKEIELTTGETVVAQVVGLGQDTPVADAENVTVATFITKNYLKTNYRMNPTNSNVGGWRDSEMRTGFIMENFYDVLPESLKGRVKQVSKKTTAGNKDTSIVTTEDYVWLPSAVELGITDLDAPYTKEGVAYTAFTENEMQAKSIRTKKSTEGGSTGPYWLRSPVTTNTTSFKTIDIDYLGFGVCSLKNASDKVGMAVGFCL